MSSKQADAPDAPASSGLTSTIGLGILAFGSSELAQADFVAPGTSDQPYGAQADVLPASPHVYCTATVDKHPELRRESLHLSARTRASVDGWRSGTGCRSLRQGRCLR